MNSGLLVSGKGPFTNDISCEGGVGKKGNCMELLPTMAGRWSKIPKFLVMSFVNVP